MLNKALPGLGQLLKKFGKLRTYCNREHEWPNDRSGQSKMHLIEDRIEGSINLLHPIGVTYKAKPFSDVFLRGRFPVSLSGGSLGGQSAFREGPLGSHMSGSSRGSHGGRSHPGRLDDELLSRRGHDLDCTRADILLLFLWLAICLGFICFSSRAVLKISTLVFQTSSFAALVGLVKATEATFGDEEWAGRQAGQMM